MKILLPVDGSSASLEAVRLVVRWVDEGLRASAVLANVQEPATLYELVRLHDAQAIERISASAGAHALEVAQVLLEQAGIEYEAQVATGEAAHLLVDLAERHGCDAICMGARGVGTTGSEAIGSVAREVLHSARVPVTIVPAVSASSDASPASADGDDGLPTE